MTFSTATTINVTQALKAGALVDAIDVAAALEIKFSVTRPVALVLITTSNAVVMTVQAPAVQTSRYVGADDAISSQDVSKTGIYLFKEEDAYQDQQAYVVLDVLTGATVLVLQI